jgi:hypothetical protein
VERPGRVVRFARLIHRPVRVLGGPAVRAASGGHLSLTWLPLTVVRQIKALAVSCGITWDGNGPMVPAMIKITGQG